MASELISSYIDLVSIRKETDLFLEQIELLKKAKDDLSKTKATLKLSSNSKEIADATAASAKAYDAATKAQDNFAKNAAKSETAQKANAKATKEAAAETDKLVGAYDRLKNQFKEADAEAKNLAAEFGVNSEQALKAAESAAALKQQLKEIDALSKNVNAPKAETKTEEVPFTHNLNEDGSVKQPDLSNATTAVNELNAAEAELTNTATAMGSANLKAADDIKTTTSSAVQASTALQELNGTIAQNVKVYNEYQTELKAVKAEQKAIEAAIKEAGAASQEDVERKIQLGIRERELKIASSELNRTINAQTKELQAAEGSYDEMNQRLGQMRDLFRQLSEQDRNSAFGQELLGRIQITDEAIKKLDADTGNFHRNVGNYQGSFSEPFKILQQELTVISEKLKDPALAGKSLEALQREEALLLKLTENLSKEFPNLTREVRAITNASNQLGAQLGEDSELFQKFAAAAGEASDAQKDLQAHVTFNASDTKYIDSAVEAVNGLAGAYSAAEGAAQLFGDGNQDVQRGMQKLQALIAITTGLQQVQNALQKESATMQGLQAAKTGLLSAAMQVQNLFRAKQIEETLAEAAAHVENAAAIEAERAAEEGGAAIGAASEEADILDAATAAQEQLTGAQEAAASVEEGLATVTEVSTAATETNTVATEENTAAEEKSGLAKLVTATRIGLLNAARKLQSFFTTQNIAATQAEAVANTELATTSEGVSIAMGEQAIATEAATAATVSLGTALIATGIGAAVVAIIYGVVKLAGAVKDWINADQIALKLSQDLAEAIAKQNEQIQKNIDLISERYKGNLQALQQELSLNEAAGKSTEFLFGKRKALADLKKKEADDRLSAKTAEAEKLYADTGVKGAEALTIAQSAYLTKYRSINSQIVGLIELRKKALVDDNKDDQEGLTKQIDQLQKEADAAKTGADNIDKIRTDAFNAQAETDKLAVEQQKYTADQRRKLLLETTNIEVDLIKTRNADILNDEKSNLDQRLQAIRSNAAAERRAIAAQKNDVLNDPSSSSVDKTLAIRKAAEEESKVTITTSRQIFETREDYRKRELTANKSMLELEVQADIDKNEKIRDNDNLSLETRMDGLNKAYQDRKSLIDAEYEYNKELNKNKNASYAEEELLEKDHEAKLAALAITTSAKVRDITLKDIEAQKAGLENLFTAQEALYNQAAAFRDVKPATDHAESILALNKQLQDGLISIDKYNRDREKLDKDYSVSQLENQVKQDKDLIDIAHKFGKDDFALQKKLADDEVALEDLKQKKIKALKEKRYEQDKAIANAGFDLLTTIGDAQFTTELNRIQTLIDANDEYYSKEIENTKNSTLTEQEKAERTTVLQAEQAAKRTQLEKKQRDEQVKQAKFDRDAQALSIAGNAIAAHFKIIAELGPIAGLPIAIANDILAAIQVATLFAKPLPKFKHGKMNDYEGYAVVGDGGKREPILRADGKVELSPDTDTLTWIGKNDKVFSDIKTFENYLTKRTDTTNNYPAAPMAVKDFPERKQAVAYTITSEIVRDIEKRIYEKNTFKEHEVELLKLINDYKSTKELTAEKFTAIQAASHADYTNHVKEVNRLIEVNHKNYSKGIEAIATSKETNKEQQSLFTQAKHEVINIQLISRIKEAELEKKKFELDLSALKVVHNINIAVHSGANVTNLLHKLPKFKTGKFSNYEGPAIVGDGFTHEPIVRENGTVELSPNQPTLTWLGKKDYVFPDIKSFTSTITTNRTDKIITNSTHNADPNKDLIVAYRQSAARVESAIKRIPQAKINFYNNGEFNEWVKVNVRGRR